VFSNDAERSSDFYRSLLYRHVTVAMRESGEEPPDDEDAFVRAAFTRRTALMELARAAEGVPRDAINLASRAAQKCFDGTLISVPKVRDAAYRWFQQDKGSAINGNEEARRLLDAIRDDVIGQRRARAFLL
jgi:hypothetical protein